jgi:benzoate-CoA ligase family protein
MVYEPPEQLNIADHFLDARVREGRGERTALLIDQGPMTYRDVQALANRFGNLLREVGTRPEERVMIALPDGAEFVAALFGTLKIGAVVVMVNPGLSSEEIRHLVDYIGARTVIAHHDTAGPFEASLRGHPNRPMMLVVGSAEADRALQRSSEALENYDTHRDDAAIWLFSGGTTGRPKAVVQTHRSFAYTAECYGRQVIGYTENDVTLSVPKLYFGYATGSNLFFPFLAGGTAALFPEPATPEALFERIRRFRPTVLVNVPTMVHKMLTHPDADQADLSSLRVSTSAGEALPAELYERWKRTFRVELLDGLGTAEMWHIFVSNRAGAVRPGTLGTVVPGFEVKSCDEDGNPVTPGETGWLWVKGGARAIGYWRHQEKTENAFRGEWYVSGDLIQIDRDGYVTYCGRGDELFKVGGKWLAPAEVEGCLLDHPAVAEAAVIGATDPSGLTKPVAYVVPRERRAGLDDELKAFVRDRLAPYKHPREVVFLDALPRTHLGKVDRGLLRRG